jgi:hypothetical protein
MNIDYFGIVLHLAAAGVCAYVYWKGAEMEDGPSPLIWAILSLMVFAVTWLWLGWRWPGIILSQVGIGVVIAVFRTVIALREERGKKA